MPWPTSGMRSTSQLTMTMAVITGRLNYRYARGRRRDVTSPRRQHGVHPQTGSRARGSGPERSETRPLTPRRSQAARPLSRRRAGRGRTARRRSAAGRRAAPARRRRRPPGRTTSRPSRRSARRVPRASAGRSRSPRASPRATDGRRLDDLGGGAEVADVEHRVGAGGTDAGAGQPAVADADQLPAAGVRARGPRRSAGWRPAGRCAGSGRPRGRGGAAGRGRVPASSNRSCSDRAAIRASSASVTGRASPVSSPTASPTTAAYSSTDCRPEQGAPHRPIWPSAHSDAVPAGRELARALPQRHDLVDGGDGGLGGPLRAGTGRGSGRRRA